MSFKVFLAFLVIRLASVFLVQTWYVPDEYWQSLEVAHKLTFGYGHLTWEWAKGIRSYIYPGSIALIYKVLDYFKLDEVELLVILPRIIQALLSAFADYRFYVWNNQRKWAIFIQMTAWFWFYTGSRTLVNTVETALTTIALSYYPWNSEQTCFLWYVALVVVIRPTAAIPWLSLCVQHIRNSKFKVAEILIKRYIVIGLLVGSLAIGIDSYFHGSLIVTPYEFLKINVFDEIGSFYGAHPWYWYIKTGLPTVLSINTIPFLFAVSETIRHKEAFPERLTLLISIILTIATLSVLPHKEFRFVLPILPMCLYLTTDFLSRWSRKATKISVWLVAISILAGNLVPATYLSYYHQRGTVDVMPIVAKIAREYKDENGHPSKFLFLMPCHSTPYYSHVHYNVTMRFLTCEPNFEKRVGYVDEADRFYENPKHWILKHLPVYPNNALPTHLIFFDNLKEKISDLLKKYKEIYSIFHTAYTTDRVGAHVLIYERINPNERDSKVPELSSDEILKDFTSQNDDDAL